MRQFIFTTLLLGLVYSCGDSSNQEDEQSTDGGKVMQSEILDTCQCSSMDIDTTGIHLLNNKEYTGICIEYYPDTTIKYIEKNLLNGRLHGKVTFYDRAGEILIERIYDKGEQKRSGEVDALSCNCSELEKEQTHVPQVPIRYKLDGIPYTGSCNEYYPEVEQLYMTVNYKDGIPHGHTIYYNKDGSTLMIEKYENGELVSIVN